MGESISEVHVKYCDENRNLTYIHTTQFMTSQLKNSLVSVSSRAGTVYIFLCFETKVFIANAGHKTVNQKCSLYGRLGRRTDN